MARLVLSGYYGLGNTGDEAVLAAIVQEMRRLDPGGRVTVLSANPEATKAVHGVAAVGRMDLAGVERALSGADLLVSGGGSLLQDVTSLRSLAYYLGVIALARLRRVPVFFYAQGVGPLRRPLARRLVGLAVRGVAGLTVRDGASADLLRACGVDRPAVEVTADPVFAYHPELPAGHEAGAGATRPVFGFAFRPWAGVETWVSEVAGAAGELAGRFGAEIRWLAFQADRDLPLAKQLQEACPVVSNVVEPGDDPARMYAEVAQCDLLIGARLHALVMAAAAGRPLVGVSYDPKVDALLGQLGLSAAGELPGLTAEQLVAAASEAWEKREELVSALAGPVAELRRRAEGTAVRALQCARGNERVEQAGVGSGAPGEARRPRVEVLGSGVDAVTLPEAAQRVADWIAAGPGPLRQVVTLNPEMIMNARRNPGFAELVRSADLVTADGVGVVWAAHQLGRTLPGRVTGVDLTSALLEEGARRGWRFFLLGAAPGVAEEAARVIARRHPGVQVAGTRHGYFSAGEAVEVAAEVASAAPDVLLVGLGSPAQEEFIARHREHLGARVALGIGGTLDVLAGRTRRAPAWMRRLGLEWFYRLARQPQRFGRALAIPVFMWEVWRRRER